MTGPRLDVTTKDDSIEDGERLLYIDIERDDEFEPILE